MERHEWGRSCALLINIINIPSRDKDGNVIDKRYGAECDTERLKNLLEQLGFEVDECTDAPKEVR